MSCRRKRELSSPKDRTLSLSWETWSSNSSIKSSRRSRIDPIELNGGGERYGSLIDWLDK